MASEPKRPTVDQLRRDIDTGRTGEKVPWPDPASAPLGTDDEAAGDPVRSRSVEQARRQERGPGQPPAHSGVGHAWIIIALVVLLIVGFLVFLARV